MTASQSARSDDVAVASRLPSPSHLVRFHPEPNAPYDRMIVVSEQDEGSTLYLQGWIGPPLTPAQWRQAKNELFPKARTVAFQRRRADGSFRDVRLPI